MGSVDGPSPLLASFLGAAFGHRLTDLWVRFSFNFVSEIEQPWVGFASRQGFDAFSWLELGMDAAAVFALCSNRAFFCSMKARGWWHSGGIVLQSRR